MSLWGRPGRPVAIALAPEACDRCGGSHPAQVRLRKVGRTFRAETEPDGSMVSVEVKVMLELTLCRTHFDTMARSLKSDGWLVAERSEFFLTVPA